MHVILLDRFRHGRATSIDARVGHLPLQLALCERWKLKPQSQCLPHGACASRASSTTFRNTSCMLIERCTTLGSAPHGRKRSLRSHKSPSTRVFVRLSTTESAPESENALRHEAPPDQRQSRPQSVATCLFRHSGSPLRRSWRRLRNLTSPTTWYCCFVRCLLRDLVGRTS